MKNSTQKTGKAGEELAAAYLSSIGQTVIARNWRASHLEIDIISLDSDGTIRFVEVKSRTAPVMAAPETNVDWRKQKRLVGAAESFLHSDVMKSLPFDPDREVCFDIVTVVFDGANFEIQYYPQAWVPMFF